MTLWTKLSADRRGNPNFGNKRRTTFAAMKTRTGHRTAALIVPEWAVRGDRCDIFHDGGNRLAFAIGERGQFAVVRTSQKGTSRRVTIPARFADRIPYGTTDVSIAQDGDMFVLDLSQFSQVKVAAE